MLLKIAILCVVFAFASADCGEDEAAGCIENLITAVMNDESEEVLCRYLRETATCLENLADRCYGNNKDKDLEDALQELRDTIAKGCPRGEIETSADIDQCVTALEDELMECISDSVADTLESLAQLPADQEPDENEIKCSMYESITRCVVRKVENNCGREAARIAHAEMADAPAEIKEHCSLAGRREDSLRGLVYDMVRRRKK